jgi:hypothetical protein
LTDVSEEFTDSLIRVMNIHDYGGIYNIRIKQRNKAFLVINQQTTKTYGGVELELNAFLISALVVSFISLLFYHQGIIFPNQLRRRLVPRGGLEAVLKKSACQE